MVPRGKASASLAHVAHRREPAHRQVTELRAGRRVKRFVPPALRFLFVQLVLRLVEPRHVCLATISFRGESMHVPRQTWQRQPQLL